MAPPVSPSPRLSKHASGSGWQFLLATLPFLALFIYFLVLAAMRPSMHVYNLANANDEAEMEEALREAGAIIALSDMMGCFLAFLGLFSMMAVYLWIFVPKRIELMKSYLETGQTVIGDIFYEGSSNHRYGSFSKYAFAMYAHPHEPKRLLIRKRIRIYQHYTREQVTILVLPYYPFSGQPKTDLEMDLAASDDLRGDKNRVLGCLIVWIIFLLVSPIYLLHQMSLIEDDYDDPKRGWIIYLCMVLLVIPVVAFGGNYARWRLHRHWVLNRGVVIQLQPGSKTAKDKSAGASSHGCDAFACMGYNAMDDNNFDTNTVSSEATPHNSVYMA
jgi:hypothetical protein